MANLPMMTISTMKRAGRHVLTPSAHRKIRFLCVLCASVLGTAAPAADTNPPGVRIVRATDATHVQVIATLPPKVPAQIPEGKLSAEQGEQFLVLALVDPKTGKPGVPVLGKYERQNGQLVL